MLKTITAIVSLMTSPCLLGDEPLLETLSRKAARIEQLWGQFEQQKTIAVLPLPLISKGSYSYSKQSGIIWQTEEPTHSRLVIREDGIYNDGKDGKIQGSRSPAGMLLDIFSGRFSGAEQQFTIVGTGTPGNWSISMVPISESLAEHIKEIRVRGRDTTEAFELFETNGDKTVIRFIAENVTLAD